VRLPAGRADGADDRRDRGQAARDEPNDAAIWNEHGSALADLGRQQAAERSYREALQRDPGHRGAWHNLAVCLKHQQRFAEALDGFRQSVDGEPLASTLHCIGHMQQELGQHDEARSTLAQAIAGYTAMLDDDPFDAEVLFWRGAAQARLRQRGDALGDLRRAIDLDVQWREAARTEEDFLELRDDPEFRALLDAT
jgi:tetratricopeptide (TPR) repeat protein